MTASIPTGQLFDDAGIDLNGELTYSNKPGRDLRAASTAVEDADVWTINNAAANGCDDDTWTSGGIWCHRPNGALPQV